MKIKTEMVIDCSGSMATVSSAVNDGVLEYANSMKDGDWLSITEFEGGKVVAPVHKAAKRDMGANPYRHRAVGMTNLYDAVGTVLSNTLQKKSMKGRVVVITTDGFENASKEFTRDAVMKLVKEFEKKGGNVMYISASADPFADALAMGIDARNTIAYAAAKTGETFSVARAAKERVRGGQAMGFTDSEREELSK